MSTADDDLLELFRRYLPRRAGRFALMFAPPYETPLWRDEDGRVRAALSLVRFDPPDGETPCDVREQEVCLGDAGPHAPERWRAYLEGTLLALPAIVAQHGEDAVGLLPIDLFVYEAVLADDALQRAEDFAAALSDPARLDALNKALHEAEWREQLEPCGLVEHAGEVRALARPSQRLHLDGDWGDWGDEDGDGGDDGDDDGDIASVIGQTRVGGAPDLPLELPWPEACGVPLTFVAQLDLAELAGRRAAGELPSHGLLSFFYAPCPPDAVHGHPVRVLHLIDTGALARRPAPAGVEPLPEYEVRIADEVQYPAIESYFWYESLLPEERVLAGMLAIAEGRGEEVVKLGPLSWFIVGASRLDDEQRPFHRVLGHPAAIQGDPYLDVEMDARGGWDCWKDGTPEALQIRKQALRWRLLLQIDAQQVPLNQDGGFLYFWIPADALARHDWTQARGAIQCH